MEESQSDKWDLIVLCLQLFCVLRIHSCSFTTTNFGKQACKSSDLVLKQGEGRRKEENKTVYKDKD